LYECIIIGGGIAGLQAAIQLGRYGRRILVIDRGDGRSALCRSYHNVLGYPDGVSGEELRRIGREQAGKFGAEIIAGDVVAVKSFGDGGGSDSVRGGGDGGNADGGAGGFRVECREGTSYEARTLLLATGVMDRIPDLPGLIPCLGLTVYICPDCDGYEIKNKPALVLGSGDTGAHMALTLQYFTSQLIYVNHEYDRKPVDESLADELVKKGIRMVMKSIRDVIHEGRPEEGRFAGVTLKDGSVLEAERAFIAFGGNEVRSDVAKMLGAERLENKHIVTEPRSKMTSVPGVWAAGDVAVHSEQMTIAMGEGQQAAIWIHKWLLREEKEGTCVCNGSFSR